MPRIRLALTIIILLASIISINLTNPSKRSSYSNYADNRSDLDQTPAKQFFAIIIDDNNTKWFLTDKGVMSLRGEKWKLFKESSKVTIENFRGFALEANSEKTLVWTGSSNGLSLSDISSDSLVSVATYHTQNSALTSNNILKIATGVGLIHWFGTDKGVAAFSNGKWLTPDYKLLYPERTFLKFPILSMATNTRGDSLYVGTAGAGVSRIYRNEVDGISGASNYSQWGPIIMPSDSVYSIFIAPDGAQWFGTNNGIAKHTGNVTLENWTVYTKEEGLVDNFVQAIVSDKDGKLWFGTKNGISVFDGSTWSSYKTENGLMSNNILCLGLDKEGVIWIGTDNGLNSFKNGKFKSFK